MPVILWNTNIIEEESEHVQAFRMMREKVKDPPILLDMGLRIWLQSMDHVRELHPITDEEDGKVVPDQIKVSLMIYCKLTELRIYFKCNQQITTAGIFEKQ